jgi:hypothetical protein
VKCPHRFWLPCFISVAAHAAILLPLLFVRTPASLLPGRPLDVDTVVVVDDPVSLTLDEPGRERFFPIKLLPAPTIAREPPVPVVMPELTMEPTPSSPIRAVSAQSPAQAPSSTGSGNGNGTGGSGWPGASTSFFAVDARGTRVVYVIDRSISMGLSGALSTVKRELMESIGRLPADAYFQVILYNRSAQALIIEGKAGLIAATPQNKQALARQLELLEAEGGTDHLPALSLALSYEPDVIYFLTDADDLRPDQVRLMTQMNRGRAVIHTIELTTAHLLQTDMPLHALARANRGTYRALALR